MSSPEDSRASLFHMRGNGGGERMSVISGRRCSALLTKSGPLGSLVKMLLESPLWWKDGYSLTWEAIPLYSRKVTTFTDTNSSEPSPSNESAEILSDSDIPSSRCLFRLRLSELPTEETGSSLLPTPRANKVDPSLDNPAIAGRNKSILEEEVAKMVVGLLPTPNAGEAEKYRLKYTPGSQMGTSLSVMAASGLLPTPQAMDGTDVRSIMGKNDVLVATKSGLRRKVQTGSDFGVSLGFLANNGLLPTPRTCSAMGAALDTKGNLEGNRQPNLETVVGRICLLPTPTARDEKNPSSPDGARIARKKEQGYTIELNDLAAMGILPTPRANNMVNLNLANEKIADDKKARLEGVVAKALQDSCPKTDGGSLRLSPLFTEEMMGFPLMWTTLPFLSQNGEPSPSKPTGMQ